MALTKIPGSLLDTASGINGLIYPTSDGTSGQFLKTDGSGNLTFATITTYTDSDVETYLDGGTSTPTFATATVSGTLTVTGDLDITGNVNSYNVTDLDVTDQTITLGAGQTEALSGGSGIIIDGSSASILWDETNDEWDFNKSINVTGNDLNLNNGSVEHRFTNDNTNLLIRADYGNSAANSTIQFSVDGSERMRINSAGNVGIGTDNPGQLLDVDGIARFGTSTYRLTIDGSADGVSIKSGTTANDESLAIWGTFGSAFQFDTTQANGFLFKHSGDTKMTIDSSGNLLVGTTTNPNSRKLRVYGISEFDGNGVSLQVFNSSGTKIGSAGQGNYVVSGGTSTGYGIQSESDLVFGSSGITERMRIDTSGNVGIGTTSPSCKLNIVDTSSANATVLRVANGYTTDAANDSSTLMFQLYRSYSPAINDAGFIKAVKEQAWDATDDRDAALTFGTRDGTSEPAERMRISSAGKVFINSSNVSAYGGLGHIVFQQPSNDLGIGIIDANETNTLQLINNGAVSKIEQNGTIPIQIKNANGVLATFQTYAVPKMNFHYVENSVGTVSTTGDEHTSGNGVMILKQQISVSAGSKIIVWYDSGQILNNNQGGNGQTLSNPQIAVYVSTNSSAPPSRGVAYDINTNTDHFWYPAGSQGSARLKMNGMGATGTLSTGGTYYIYVYGGSYNIGSYTFNYQQNASSNRGSSIIWAEVMA